MIRSNNLKKLHDKIDFLSSDQVPALHLEPSGRYFDADHDGQLKVPELVAAGFLNPREATFFVRKDMGGEWNMMLCMKHVSIIICIYGLVEVRSSLPFGTDFPVSETR